MFSRDNCSNTCQQVRTLLLMLHYILCQERGGEGEVKGEVGAGEKSPEGGGAPPGGQCG